MGAGIPINPFHSTKQRRMHFHLDDWPEPIPQRTLGELGLPMYYAVAPWQRRVFEANPPRTDEGVTFPYRRQGKFPNAQALWELTPAFRDSYDSPTAMVYALLHPPSPDTEHFSE